MITKSRNLKNETYFTPFYEMKYLGSTQYKGFQACEAAELAMLLGKYEKPKSDAFLLGSFVDAFFEGNLEVFKKEHPEIFKKDGTLRAEFAKAEKDSVRASGDGLFQLLMTGRKQIIRVGEIGGVRFKIKIDNLVSDFTCKKIVDRFPETESILKDAPGAIVDLKYMKDFKTAYSPEEHARVPFIKHYGYDIQGAIYQAIEGRGLPFIIAGISKEEPCDITAIFIPSEVLKVQLVNVEAFAQRYSDIKNGLIKPEPCGKCEYCRSKKKLTSIINYLEDDEDVDE